MISIKGTTLQTLVTTWKIQTFLEEKWLHRPTEKMRISPGRKNCLAAKIPAKPLAFWDDPWETLPPLLVTTEPLHSTYTVRPLPNQYPGRPRKHGKVVCSLQYIMPSDQLEIHHCFLKPYQVITLQWQEDTILKEMNAQKKSSDYDEAWHLRLWYSVEMFDPYHKRLIEWKFRSQGEREDDSEWEQE